MGLRAYKDCVMRMQPKRSLFVEDEPPFVTNIKLFVRFS